jgi:hypothetical protein
MGSWPRAVIAVRFLAGNIRSGARA